MVESGQRAEIEALYSQGYDNLGKFIARKIVQANYIWTEENPESSLLLELLAMWSVGFGCIVALRWREKNENDETKALIENWSASSNFNQQS